MLGQIFKVLITFHRFFLNILGGSTVGVRVIVVSLDNKKVLLVKHTYCPGWYLPGGGVNNGEHPDDAAVREIREEAGVITKDDPMLFGIYFQKYKKVNDYPIVYVVTHFEEGRANSVEISEVKWFGYDDLPLDMNHGSKNRIQEYFGLIPKSRKW
ncbi:NUDIX domain-containing protein [Francisellaceae bacterium]|nr:NUDIX domain-containing protein [Francisellaceae bacterium]